MEAMNPLERAAQACDGLVSKLGVTPQRFFNWKTRGLPRTELTGETDFAGTIERETRRKVRKAELLEWSFPHLKRRAAA
jgi:hypothetical protein